MNQKLKGYEMDDSGKITAITTLYNATQWFKHRFSEERQDNSRIRTFKFVHQIQGDFITDYSKESYQNMEEKGYNYRTQREDQKKFTVCWVVEVSFISTFGTRDKRYYYVIFRKNWFSRWANIYYERAKKYFGKDGITMKTDIYIDSLKSKATMTDISKISTLVLVTGDTKIHYMPMSKVLDIAAKGIGICTDKYNQQIVGLAASEFTDTDPTNYI